MSLECPLCRKKELQMHYKSPRSDEFWSCQSCGFIFRSPRQWLSKEEENKRYLTHENDVESEGYHKFLSPVLEAIEKRQTQGERGLDYGCGPKSLIAHVLNKKGYKVDVWDPYFHPQPQPAAKAYDYVSCTEVIEHFRDPISETEKMLNTLKPGGRLYIKTAWVDSVTDFPRWHYHRDPTHVGFFGSKSFQYLIERLQLSPINMQEACTVLATSK